MQLHQLMDIGFVKYKQQQAEEEFGMPWEEIAKSKSKIASFKLTKEAIQHFSKGGSLVIDGVRNND